MSPVCVEFEIMDDGKDFHCKTTSTLCTRVSSGDTKHMIYPYGTPSPTIAST